MKETRRILISDPDPSFREWLRIMLLAGAGDHGDFELVEVATPSMVLPQAGESACILLGAVAPGEDERAALNQLLGLAAPVIILSPVRLPRAGVEWLHAGATDCLFTGSLTPEVLYRAVEHAIARGAELRQGRKLLVTLLDATPDLVWVKDSEGRMTMGNHATLALLGAGDPAKVIGYGALELIPDPAQAKRILENDAAILASGITQTVEEEFGPPERLLIFQSTKTPLRNAAGEVTGLLGISRDITARRRMEEALRASEERMQLAFRVGRSYAFEWEPVSDSVKRSHSCGQILQLSGDEVLNDTGARYFQRVHPEDRERFVSIFRCLNPSNPGYATEYRVQLADGGFVTLEEQGEGSFDAQGRLVRLIGVATDVTERKRSEARLEAALRDLQEAQCELIRRERFTVLGQLAGGVAHEVRTPLTVMRNAVEYFKLIFPNLEGEACDALQEMDRAIASANHIISEMLDFVREPFVERSVFPLGDAVLQGAKLVALPSSVRLRLPEHGLAECVETDPEQISRIIANLVLNAVQAMPEGGDLEIAIDAAEAGFVSVFVRDTGCGIAPEHLDKIFEPLFTTKVRGIGLGLAVCQRYARLNGGELSVVGGVRPGTTFRLTLPKPDRLS